MIRLFCSVIFFFVLQLSSAQNQLVLHRLPDENFFTLAGTLSTSTGRFKWELIDRWGEANGQRFCPDSKWQRHFSAFLASPGYQKHINARCWPACLPNRKPRDTFSNQRLEWNWGKTVWPFAACQQARPKNAIRAQTIYFHFSSGRQSERVLLESIKWSTASNFATHQRACCYFVFRLCHKRRATKIVCLCGLLCRVARHGCLSLHLVYADERYHLSIGLSILARSSVIHQFFLRAIC